MRRGGDGLCPQCKDCQKAYRDEHKAEIQERDRKYRLDNIDKTLAKTRKWHSDNRDAECHRRRQRYSQNIESEREKKRNHYDRNKEKIKLYVRSWQIKNPDKVRAVKQNRRAQKKSGGHFTAEQWRQLKTKYGFACLCCGKREPEILLTPDHILPLVYGGLNTIENIQPLCLHCNLVKNKKMIDYRPPN